ncbi:hypothetical protein K435DRAFT_391369 [Dendrothele bispora CBS 962.96]|uniref:Uncharacterized protein n=1 Tax=Dendrothele bispora (strain CBS 962.96) TaxID=1314807 RepID=A0A4S8L960_DENBC|nr:hypothetical protein K435DRAFT_391369 [Dendrothele bispora CBS 962.96]
MSLNPRELRYQLHQLRLDKKQLLHHPHFPLPNPTTTPSRLNTLNPHNVPTSHLCRKTDSDATRTPSSYSGHPPHSSSSIYSCISPTYPSTTLPPNSHLHEQNSLLSEFQASRCPPAPALALVPVPLRSHLLSYPPGHLSFTFFSLRGSA